MHFFRGLLFVRSPPLPSATLDLLPRNSCRMCANEKIVKLPFPLTIRFKSMLQSGVATRDLDVRWVSSLSWYFLNLMGLQSIFGFILGADNGNPLCLPFVFPLCKILTTAAANQMSQQMAMANPAAGVNPFQPGADPDKLYKSEAENLEVMEYFSLLDGIEERVLHNWSS